jgi:protein-S-isoprenylcysteine O-methyltransferase Ste14
MKTGIRVTTTSVGGILSWIVILLLPAGTLHYWQAWVFIAVFTVATIVPTVYLSRANPAALQRRMRAGPRAETRTAQKFIITASFLGLFVTMVFSALDHRFGWSSVPAWVSLLGDVLVAAGVGIAMLVIVQ